MTDYFALLDQPRKPWLDSERLKQIFHEKSLHAHPDARAGGDAAPDDFTDLNQAYQVLRDPKRRLQHLLTLAGHQPSSQSTTVPAELEKLFPVIAGLTQEAETLLQKSASATSAISRSLLKPQLLATSENVEQTLRKLTALFDDAQNRLQHVSDSAVEDLSGLFTEFSYLSKWISDLRERHLRLENAL